VLLVCWRSSVAGLLFTGWVLGPGLCGPLWGCCLWVAGLGLAVVAFLEMILALCSQDVPRRTLLLIGAQSFMP
jgi:hypothetical protein